MAYMAYMYTYTCNYMLLPCYSCNISNIIIYVQKDKWPMFWDTQ